MHLTRKLLRLTRLQGPKLRKPQLIGQLNYLKMPMINWIAVSEDQ